MTERGGGRFDANYAVSREQLNPSGGKMYVQDLISRDGEQIYDRIEGGGVAYFCGLKGMMPGVLEAFEGICEGRGVAFKEKMKEWKSKGRWHVEVY
mmetsp:Transcript_16869/g.33692  ORF Transcript_16869/g.33692 Transcript_16869/m.33692 type:complete len:96 (+) Transcript_16869:80-367(+)